MEDDYNLLQAAFDGLNFDSEKHRAWIGGIRNRFGGFDFIHEGKSHQEWLFDYYTGLPPKEQSELVKKWTRSKNGTKKNEQKKLTVDLSFAVHGKLDRLAQKEGFSKQNLIKHLVNVYVNHPEILRHDERVEIRKEMLTSNEQAFSDALKAEFELMKEWIQERNISSRQSVPTEHNIESLCQMLEDKLSSNMADEEQLNESVEAQIINLGNKIRAFQAGVMDV
ncbi:hypothetical protein [Vibrio alginolyticus]|uniref:hypothetical protein n=1 Tax=Vibrio alginolyticus TaxID=663 RepID=UPI00211A4D54|nr:hypothetical protein [Vibrio alginolyticus]MCQ9087085.1 hypothetical protein [Vibrio alginolyticus]